MGFGQEQLEFFNKKNYLNGGTLENRINEIVAVVKRYEDDYSPGLAERVRGYIHDQILSPSTPQWANLGKFKEKGTTPLPSSCYIVNPTNSIQGIYYSIGETAMMSKLGGGVGADFSSLADKGTLVEEGFYTNSKLDWVEDLVAASQKVSQGCYDDQTEVLTDQGWKFFSEVLSNKGLMVAQVLDNEVVEFVNPSEYFEYDVSEDLLLFKDKKNINLLVTKNHNMVYKQERKVINNGAYTREVKDKFYLETAENCPLHRDVKYLHGGILPTGNGLSFKERLMIAHQADGGTVKKCGDAIQFRFSKNRKADRLRWILDNLNLKYSYSFYESTMVHSFYVNVGEEFSKDLSWVDITKINQSWCDDFLFEVSQWDGSKHGEHGVSYSSIHKINCDIIQSVCAISGYKSYTSLDPRDNRPNAQPIHKISYSSGNYFGVEKIDKEAIHYTGKVYCVEVPSHRIIVRRGGKTVVCGNSQRRGYSVPFFSIDDPEFYDVLKRREKTNPDKNDPLVSNNIAFTLPIGFWDRIKNGDKELQKRFLKCLAVRESDGSVYLLDIANCNKNQSPVYSILGHTVCSSNICCEALTPKYDDKSFVCVLSSLNLVHWDKIKENPQIIKDAMMFLDINVSEFIRLTEGVPFMEKAHRSAVEKRDIGLGTLGFHEYLQSKGASFGGIESRRINKEIYSTIRKYADEYAVEIGEKLGSPAMCQEAGLVRRNVSLMMCAPNKSTSFLCGETSLGVEPFFSNYFVKSLSGIQNTHKNKYLKKLLEEKGRDTTEVWDSILNNLGSVQHLDFLSKEEKSLFKTASEISPKDIIDLAADRQVYIDMAQSINLFNRPNYTKKDIYDIHKYAFEKGLKTLYYYYPQAHAALEKAGDKWDTCESCAD